jgi:hypothetical protein
MNNTRKLLLVSFATVLTLQTAMFVQKGLYAYIPAQVVSHAIAAIQQMGPVLPAPVVAPAINIHNLNMRIANGCFKIDEHGESVLGHDGNPVGMPVDIDVYRSNAELETLQPGEDMVVEHVNLGIGHAVTIDYDRIEGANEESFIVNVPYGRFGVRKSFDVYYIDFPVNFREHGADYPVIIRIGQFDFADHRAEGEPAHVLHLVVLWFEDIQGNIVNLNITPKYV